MTYWQLSSHYEKGPDESISRMMKNLMHDELTHAELVTLLAQTEQRSALPKLGSPHWDKLRENPYVQVWLQPLTELAQSEANSPLPELTDALYCDFFNTGQRLPFENVYFERRRRLGRAAITLLLSGRSDRERHIPSFLKKLTSVLDENSWTLPAHAWEEPNGQDPWQIDLFAAECANNFAEMLYVFEGIIPAKLAERIRQRLRIYIFENYANRQPPFHWTNISNNWNAVCHQGVLGAALTIEEDHALLAHMLQQAAAGIPHYIAGFGEDGATSEGPGYWSYGFGWFSELNAQLEYRTEGQLSLFANNPKVRRMAQFAPNMTFSNGYLVNFSDGHRKGRLSAPLLTYLGQRLEDSTLSTQARSLYENILAHGVDLGELRRDFFNLTRLALRSPDPETPRLLEDSQASDMYWSDYGAIVTRGMDNKGHLWEFAAKAGHNDEHHNHNDCGSWLLNIDSTPVIIEIGAPEYTHSFFNEERYTHLAARSLGHSVPFVNNFEQATGRDFSSTIRKVEVGGNLIRFSIDLTKAYPVEAGCKKLKREWELDKDAGILKICDLYELDEAGPVETAIITETEVTQINNEVHLKTASGKVILEVHNGAQVSTIETCAYRGHHGTDESVTRIRLKSSSDQNRGSLSYKIRIEQLVD